jgi:single-strand DNA-binding protein
VIVGNLVADPEIRHTNDNRMVANLRLATSESWRDKSTGERKERSEFHRVTIFNEALASIAEKRLKKGTLLYLEGSIQTRKYTDKDGIERYSTEIVLSGFNGMLQILGGGKHYDDVKEADDGIPQGIPGSSRKATDTVF